MSNHFHLVVYYDPKDSYRWSDEEVADRWLSAYPPRAALASPEESKEILAMHRALLLVMPERLLHARKTLGSLSMFMKHLKQSIAYRANKEDCCTGHFFEGRFYSGALLDENAVIAAMAYVDLNPVRARIVEDIAAYEAASGAKRMSVAANRPKRLSEAIMPLVSGLTKSRPPFNITLSAYRNIVEGCTSDLTRRKPDKKSRWHERIGALRKRQRAFGSMGELLSWQTERGWSVPGKPLPAI